MNMPAMVMPYPPYCTAVTGAWKNMEEVTTTMMSFARPAMLMIMPVALLITTTKEKRMTESRDVECEPYKNVCPIKSHSKR